MVTQVAMSYAKYMQSQRWASRKSAYYAKHQKSCRACRSEDQIDLHHRTYERMGFEPDSDLVPLCSRCHAAVHDMHKRLGGSLREVTATVIRQLKAEAAGRESKARKPPARQRRRAKVTHKDPVSAALAQIESAQQARARERRRSGL